MEKCEHDWVCVVFKDNIDIAKRFKQLKCKKCGEEKEPEMITDEDYYGPDGISV